jgi:hypothetical protein
VTTSWRGYLLDNAGWKLAALLLASLIWLTIRKAHDDPSANLAGGESRLLGPIPITVLTAAADTRTYRVRPAQTTVALRGHPEDLRALQPGVLEAYVSLLDTQDSRRVRRRVQLHLPPGLMAERIDPAEVEVEVEELRAAPAPPP